MKKIIFIGLLTLALIVFFGDKYQKEVQKKNQEDYLVFAEKVSKRQEEIKLQEAAVIETYSDLYKMLYKKEVKTIKLLGDSITAGVGPESHYYPEAARIIFDNGQEQFKESAFTSISWANMLRKYTSSNDFGNVDVINAGVGGKTATWALKNIEYLITDDEDIVFVMYGTNDRVQSNLEEYEKNIRTLLEIVDEKSDKMVVMSPPPSVAYENMNFSAEDIDILLKEIAQEEGYTFISHFDGINKYLNDNEVKYEALMQTDGAHPIEKGYEVMWQTIRNELELQ